MCDEEQLARWGRDALSRRQFGALAGAAAVTACMPMDSNASDMTLPAMKETNVTFTTADGTMDAFFVEPLISPVPAVILWPDIAGLREAKRDMARRLAGRGHAVLVLNPYYRDVAGEQFRDFATFAGGGGFQKVGPWRAKLTAEAITRDARAAVSWLDAQASVDKRRGIGTQGYCMGGPFTMWTAAAAPGRVRAAASFHGGGLVRPDAAMSPHKLFGQMRADLLVAVAQDDDAEAPEEKVVLRESARAAGRTAMVEVYRGDHGWTVPDSPAYADGEAERAWSDLLRLYERALG